MSGENLGLRRNVSVLLAWIFVFPFLAAWPFLSAFPAFSLVGSSTFDLSTSIKVVFLVTGFWALASVFVVMWWLTNGKVRSLYRSSAGLLLGAYAIVWTGLYIIASMADR